MVPVVTFESVYGVLTVEGSPEKAEAVTELERACAEVAKLVSEVEVQCEECGWAMMVRSSDLPVVCAGPERGRHLRLACHIISKADE